MLWGSVVQRKENKMTWAGKQAGKEVASFSKPWHFLNELRTYEGALGFLKVTVFVSVRRVKSLLPPKSHRSLSTHVLLLLLVTLTCILHMTKSLQLAFINCFSFIFHSYQLGEWLEVCVPSLFKVHIYKHLLGKSRMVSWVIEKQRLFLFHGYLLWFSSI